GPGPPGSCRGRRAPPLGAGSRPGPRNGRRGCACPGAQRPDVPPPGRTASRDPPAAFLRIVAGPLPLPLRVLMYPWARLVIQRSQRIGKPRSAPAIVNPMLTAITTLALSVGSLSLVMLWMGLLGLAIDWRLTALACLVISAAGWLLLLRIEP